MKLYTTVEAINAYLHYAQSIGLAEDALLSKAGITKCQCHSSHGYIDEAILTRLLLALEELGKEPLLGLRQAKQVQANTFDILGYVALNCDTLKQCMEKVILYEGAAGNLGYTQIIPVGSDILISWYCEINQPQAKRHTTESVVARWAAYARELVRLDESAKAVWFEHAAPDCHDDIKEYQQILQCPVYFDQPYSGIVVTSQQWHLPFPQANPALRAAFESNAQQILKKFQLLLVGSQGFTEQTRRVLRNMQRSELRFNKAEVAAQFGMSLRTLQRRLEKENSSYHMLVEEVRMERALELLHSTTLSTSEIALRLGYQEVRSFYRALKRVTGKTASEIRGA